VSPRIFNLHFIFSTVEQLQSSEIPPQEPLISLLKKIVPMLRRNIEKTITNIVKVSKIRVSIIVKLINNEEKCCIKK